MSTRLMERLDALARFSDDPTCLTRLYLTASHAAAAGQVLGWMREAGLEASFDAAGTVVGRTPSGVGRRLLIGSHIDTARDAGRYDGTLGVLAAIEAMAQLREAGETLPFPVTVLGFGDEEGVRFPATMTGSRSVAGTLDPANLMSRDASGETMADALATVGGDPVGLPGVALRPDEVRFYVELHIEQGPVLEAAGRALGVVTAIAGATRLAVTVSGTAGHAGTVPMGMRHDALVAACEMILAVERLAAAGQGLVATVGQIAVTPGAPNSIPGCVRFTVDLRAPADRVRLAALGRLRAALQGLADERGVRLEIEQTHEVAATACDPGLQERLAAAIAAVSPEAAPLRLASGAGHDAMVMASLCPVGMLFLRCRGGVSHHPDEAITGADAALAVAALLAFLRGLADDA